MTLARRERWGRKVAVMGSKQMRDSRPAGRASRHGTARHGTLLLPGSVEGDQRFILGGCVSGLCLHVLEGIRNLQRAQRDQQRRH